MSPQLCVTNIERSIEFYTNKLGFNIHFRYKYFYTGIIKDGFSVHLNAGGPLERERKKMNDGADILFSVENIKGLYKMLSDEFVSFNQSLRNMPYGKEFYIEDPDGNIVAFLEEV